MIVADASLLISLAILEKLDVLDQLFDEIYIPVAVYDEIRQENKAYATELKSFAQNRVREVQNQLALQLLKRELDAGEAEAIVLAIESEVPNILIDEHKGRKIAETNGLLPIGMIGVLIRAKRMGLIQAVKPNLDKLIENRRRISKALYVKALELSGEK